MEKWIKTLPTSRMVYPDTLGDRCKYLFWRIYTPLHPYLRDTSTALGLVKHEERQPYLIGMLDPKRSVPEFVKLLVEKGFGNHFVAWKDTDEIVSLRRTDGFRNQYHIRVFKDGEVRCHYEYTPEYSPLLHLFRVGFESRSEEFTELLKDWIIPCSSVAA